MKLRDTYVGFEQTFLLLLKKAKQGPISVHDFLTTLSGRGRILLLSILSLGFAQIPGVAIVLGLFMVYLGIRIALGRNFIWMPQFILRRKIGSFLLIKVIKNVLRMLKFMKRWTRPRYEWATQKSSTRVLNGIAIALIGLSLANAPPIPFVDLIANASIFFIAIGLLNEDGVYIILGYVGALIYLVTVVVLMNYCSLSQMMKWVLTGISSVT